MRVFVSSVMAGFQEEREAARKAIELLRHEAVMAESFGAQPQSSQSACLEQVRNSDVYVGIFGQRYGFVAPSGMSVTEEEFQEARKRGLRILVFVSEGDKEEEQAAFLQRVGDYNSGYFYAKYNSAGELQERIIQGLNDLGRADGRKKSAEEAAALFEERCRTVRPERHQAGLVVGVTPTHMLGEILSPRVMNDAAFHEEVMKLLLFGDNPRLFQTSLGSRTEEGRDFVRLLQQSDGRRESFTSLTLYADGMSLLVTDLALPSKGTEYAIMMGSVIDSRLTQEKLGSAIKVAARYYQLLDDRRVASLYLLAELSGINQKQFGPVPKRPPRSMSMQTRDLGHVAKATDRPLEVSLPQLMEGEKIASDCVDRWVRFFKAEGAYFAAETSRGW